MYATKQAIMAIEHEPDTEVQVFLMDMRSFSKGYEEYYRRAQQKYGIKYTHCRVSSVKENPENNDLILRYLTEQGALHTEEFDMVVLSVGMEISESVRRMAGQLGVAVDEHGFARTDPFMPLQTSRPGVYAIGPFRSPKDIPESVIEASGAAAAAGGLLAPARGTLTRKIEYPPEHDTRQEDPQVGVFVCHCGSNIGGFVDVPDVAEYAQTLPNVTHAEHNLYTCSQDSIIHITEQVKELGLNRVVVASCTPLTHEPLFQSCIRAAGLNEHLFEMANIRNQCSWVHSNNRPGATKKAKDLLRMAVARATELEPLHTQEVPVEKTALIIGGGLAGMTAALNLAQQGFPVHLIEREAELGGNLRNVRYFVSQNGSTPRAFLADLIAQVEANPLITVHLQTEIESTTGFKGNFESELRRQSSEQSGRGGASGESSVIEHGVTIVATGAIEYQGPEYQRQDPRVITQQEFEALLGNWENRELGGSESGESPTPQSLAPPARAGVPNSLSPNSPLPNSLVMIQCAGKPSEKFCSRICCTQALKNALKLKELNPQAQITIIYRDIRTYGFYERLYTEAREKGVLFVQYDFERKPEVSVNGKLEVQVYEPQLGRELTLQPDALVLSMPIVPHYDADELATRLKVSVDLDGFFLEAHVKLRPVDFGSDGVYMAGMAHYPKLLDETVVQAQAAAARAALILSQDTMTTNAMIARVDPDLCVGCLTCVRICPYDVPKIDPALPGVGGILGAAYIEPAICHGCGSCASECPAKAIEMMHHKDAQVLKKVGALFSKT
jgi:heterodisulfide reductase subunit A